MKDGLAWQYQYHLTDHLGNVRVVLSDTNGDHEPEILQDQAYYPFGLEIADLSMSNLASPNDYRYNGKELNREFGLDWYCYGFRNYDPILARFPSVDPIADKFAFVSPFNYAENRPINGIDLWGLQYVDVNTGESGPIDVLNSSSTESELYDVNRNGTQDHYLPVVTVTPTNSTATSNSDAGAQQVGFTLPDDIRIAKSEAKSNSEPYGGISISTLLGTTSDGVGGLGTGLTTQGGSIRLTNGAYNGNTLSPKYYASGWGGGSRAQIKTYKLKNLGKVGGRLGTAGTIVLGTADVSINAYSERGFGIETQKATGRFAGSFAGGVAGAYVGAHFFGIGALPGGIIGGVAGGYGGSKAGEAVVEKIQK